MSRETDVAWAAGLFEGEGCISVSHTSGVNRDQTQVKLIIRMTDRDAVDGFHRIVGLGTFRENDYFKRKHGHKMQYDWQVGAKKDVPVVMDLLEPYLCGRRKTKLEEAREALKMTRSPNDPRPQTSEAARSRAASRLRTESGQFS